MPASDVLAERIGSSERMSTGKLAEELPGRRECILGGFRLCAGRGVCSDRWLGPHR